MHEKLIEFINSLESPDFIAEFFERLGVTGDRQEGESCVISNWLLQSTDLQGVTTDLGEVVLFFDNYFDHIETYELSATAQAFMEAFDEGKYPSLISEEISPW